MTEFSQILGTIVVFGLCPVVGALPLIRYSTQLLAGQDLARVGTGNISISAAFYHGGQLAGIVAVLTEAARGIGAVLLARYLLGTPAWELVALLAVVYGRYVGSRSAGTTNVVWGAIAHDPGLAGLVFLIGGGVFTLNRDRTFGKYLILVLLPLLTLLLHSRDHARVGAAVALSLFLGWVYGRIPDDLDLQSDQARQGARPVFNFFKGEKGVITLAQTRLNAAQIGTKAANLANLHRLGYPVPPGWVLRPGDDLDVLIQYLQPSPDRPLIVRSSALGEDTDTATAAGQYLSVGNITDRDTLQQAIVDCLQSYDHPTAQAYRRRLGIADAGMAVLIQPQVRGVFSGVAFSRDPIANQELVAIEALPGSPEQVVSGRITPEMYQINPNTDDLPTTTGDVPGVLLQEVARLARQIEASYHGIPQDIEWTYDGDRLWVLQSRPITTLLPIWTRKIASEVIPGAIRPLTWSINQPLTCRVWGEIFTLVLGQNNLDFMATATLHNSYAYFNATLLGEIFRSMGLPPESLEFLTRGSKFTKPPLQATLRNLPGLLRLLGRELSLERDFSRDYQRQFAPLLDRLSYDQEPDLGKINEILTVLTRATYYNILAPLSFALRQALLRLDVNQLDNSRSPEVAAMRSLEFIAQQVPPDGELSLTVQAQFEQWLQIYGYLSGVATDIAIPRWREQPEICQSQFQQLIANPTPEANRPRTKALFQGLVQTRLDLKGRVTEVYNRLLAHLRWLFVALENRWLEAGLLTQAGDIFFLTWPEIAELFHKPRELKAEIAERRSLWQQHQAMEQVPPLVYGHTPYFAPPPEGGDYLQGICASPGQKTGTVKVVRQLQDLGTIDRDTILVVPYTDAGWSIALAQAGGLIAEVGGKLSHGAIIAREYGIPAVMDIANATSLLQDGQRVKLDGSRGTVELM